MASTLQREEWNGISKFCRDISPVLLGVLSYYRIVVLSSRVVFVFSFCRIAVLSFYRIIVLPCYRIVVLSYWKVARYFPPKENINIGKVNFRHSSVTQVISFALKINLATTENDFLLDSHCRTRATDEILTFLTLIFSFGANITQPFNTIIRQYDNTAIR